MNKKCYNCGYNGDVTFYWLVVNDSTDKALASYELSDDDISEGDRLIEVECCPGCGCDL